jgi:outer membrane protein OmpA-like peptidoglycan-associated protein
VLNSKDKCRYEAEDYDGDQDGDGCPEWDRDGDGIPDDRDQCPEDPEDQDGFEDTDGCPEPDNDLDGICDPWVAERGLQTKYAGVCKGVDKCANQPEDMDGWEDTDGCPEVDNDNDGIPDTKDRCPNVAEDFNGFEDDDGCPDADKAFKSIVVKDDRIELKEKVFFAFNKSKIMAQSFPMLREVATVLKNKQSIKVRIEGHTDNKGNAKYNKKLSEQRAKAVRDFLIKEGIAADRMIAVGYGPDNPIADNKTEEGRDQNRRVEFFIIEQ